jgi:hypothetical protein
VIGRYDVTQACEFIDIFRGYDSRCIRSRCFTDCVYLKFLYSDYIRVDAKVNPGIQGYTHVYRQLWTDNLTNTADPAFSRVVYSGHLFFLIPAKYIHRAIFIALATTIVNLVINHRSKQLKMLIICENNSQISL